MNRPKRKRITAAKRKPTTSERIAKAEAAITELERRISVAQDGMFRFEHSFKKGTECINLLSNRMHLLVGLGDMLRDVLRNTLIGEEPPQPSK